MRHVSAKFGRSKARGFAVGAGLTFVCLMGSLPAKAQVAAPVRGPVSNSTSRLLNAKEGRSIAQAAWEQSELVSGAQDCSHFVHQIYLRAGFEYPYASSFDIYAGNENFRRVKTPRAGDLIVWPGHVGIVVDPMEHSFYSLVSTGSEVQDYEGPYWKSRGRPRFYRYRIGGAAGILSAARTPTTRQVSNTAKQPAATLVAERSLVESSTLNQLPKAVSERESMLYGPPAPPAPVNAVATFEVPSSVFIAAGSKSPTQNEVAEGISEWGKAAGNVLSSDDPLKTPLPLVIVEQFSVARVEIKRDHGWAYLQIDSKVSIADGQTHVKRQREKIRWELRRTDSGWEAVAPAARTYVPRDVAVKNLAAQLARLTSDDAPAKHQEAVLRQESQLANLLSALLESK
ncbi:MAG: NlpC/P60 family protein [Candidatus Acidiferrum sp.]